MGLDMYAYCATKEYDHDSDSGSRELAYWRKHPNLHGWMENLYRTKGGTAEMFNGVELELTWEDLDRLERDVRLDLLPSTSGFFFGENNDSYYKESDLEFIKKARAELFSGLRVFYDSSW